MRIVDFFDPFCYKELIHIRGERGMARRFPPGAMGFVFTAACDGCDGCVMDL
jgi:hypothetical protein